MRGTCIAFRDFRARDWVPFREQTQKQPRGADKEGDGGGAAKAEWGGGNNDVFCTCQRGVSSGTGMDRSQAREGRGGKKAGRQEREEKDVPTEGVWRNARC